MKRVRIWFHLCAATYQSERQGYKDDQDTVQMRHVQSRNAGGNPSTMRAVSTLTCTRRHRCDTKSAGSASNQALGSLTIPLSLSRRMSSCAYGSRGHPRVRGPAWLPHYRGRRAGLPCGRSHPRPWAPAGRPGPRCPAYTAPVGCAVETPPGSSRRLAWDCLPAVWDRARCLRHR